MHAIRPDRGVLLGALLAFICALAAAAAAPSLSDVDFGGGGDAAAKTSTTQTAEPVWATDPLAPPALLR
jgi:hypothetical protein